MFGNLKERLINVSKNVKLFSEPKTPQAPSISSSVNLNAGARILNHYQVQWQQLHEINEDNAKNAAELADIIFTMHEKISVDQRNINDIINLVDGGSQNLSKGVEHCLEQVQQLTESFETVESSLLQLENLIENLELQEKQLEHRFQLALYKERKLGKRTYLFPELQSSIILSVILYKNSKLTFLCQFRYFSFILLLYI